MMSTNDLGKRSAKAWVDLLIEQPELEDKCEWFKLNGYNWMELLTKRPEFADKCDWRKVQRVPVGFWYNFLIAQPQFADKCDPSIVAVWQRPDILLRFPEIALDRRCDWSHLDAATVARLLKDYPECERRVDWEGFTIDRADWDALIAVRPQFAMHKPSIREPFDKNSEYAKCAGWEWVKMICDDPDMAEECDWSKLTGEDWNFFFREDPDLAEEYWEDNVDHSKYSGKDWVVYLENGGDWFFCDSWKLSGGNIVDLLESCPEYAAYCDFSVLDGEQWVRLILLDEEYAEKCNEWYLLDEDDWRTLLADCPQFADKCKEVGYEPQDLIDDTDDDCDEDGCDLEFFESEDGSGEIFVS